MIKIPQIAAQCKKLVCYQIFTRQESHKIFLNLGIKLIIGGE